MMVLDVANYPDPFAAYTDQEITDAAIYLKMICGRSSLAKKGRGQKALCGVANAVNTYLGQRGLPLLTPPYQAPPKRSL